MYDMDVRSTVEEVCDLLKHVSSAKEIEMILAALRKRHTELVKQHSDEHDELKKLKGHLWTKPEDQ